MVKVQTPASCPACGTPLSQEGSSEGLCPACVFELALDSPSLHAELEDPDDDGTLVYSREAYSPGQVLGKRYRIRSLLGRGGMGEVWRASDIKLRVDVALKALRRQLLEDTRALETLRQEVRVAREVVSPNVCRVFDLVELDGQELVSMEYIDGITLLDILKMRAPLDLSEAREIASQFLAGLEAIHAAGLVHRDVKPENLMMTRSGRVVLMDFGIAKGLAEGLTGTVSGTPAYMAPEQARGEAFDARADVFSAGVVLAEMIAPAGVKSFEDRQQIWQGIHHEPPEIPDSPWASVLTQAVAAHKEQRHSSAAALARALEEVTLRVAGAEDIKPYPGLASFTEEDAEYFFGRELEVEAMWKKLQRPHLLGLIGPSGAGKSSFLRAGLLPVMPTGWRAVVTAPGSRPMTMLAQALADEISGDSEAVRDLVRFEEMEVAVSLFSRWRRQHDEALLIVDQFEELFTQNPPEVQERFAELLGKLALDSDVHVLLSMRDDFLFHCHSFKSLQPILSELTLLGPPVGTALRRAVVQPALRCGYRFEEDSLVDQMVSEVGSERGALPMLAFAAARLWDHRDREQGLLTREAYEHTGGVGGALAQHAEQTLEKIGQDRIPIVRELFRNLVTAQGTRTARDRDELLSVFDGREGDPLSPQAPKPSESRSAAAEILDTLIDARLLTSYEVPAAEEGEPNRRRIEIIHESLLSNWPRLVRWQTQDVEGAQLRDEVRQAAQMWEQHSRSEDLLWTGTAFQEFQLWRERYPGGLTEIEEAYGDAMVGRAERRRRQRRIVLGTVFAVLLAVLGIIIRFWQISVIEAQRAEAANLRSLAQLHLEEHPTETIAYAIASLEKADDLEMRYLALEALWRSPTEFRLPTASPYGLDFSPDGRWLATADPGGGGALWPSDGGPPTALENSDVAMEIRISPRGDLVAATMDTERRELGLWSVPEGRYLRSFALGDQGATFYFQFSRHGERLITSTDMPAGGGGLVRSWPVEGGEPSLIARLEIPMANMGAFYGVNPTESHLSWADGHRVRIARLAGTSVDMASTRSVEHDQAITDQTFDKQGRHLMTADRTGKVRIWAVDSDPPKLIRSSKGAGGTGATIHRFDPSGSILAGMYGNLLNLAAPIEARPLQLLPVGGSYGLAFHPTGRWLVTGSRISLRLRPLTRPYPQVLPGHEDYVLGVRFTPDGKYLVSMSDDNSVRLWPLDSSSGKRSRVLHRAEGAFEVPLQLAMAPDGSFVVTGSPLGQVLVLPFDGRSARELSGFTDVINRVAVGRKSRLVLAGGGNYVREEAIVRIWDLETGETRILDAGDGEGIRYLDFTAEGDVLVHSGQKLRRWNLAGEAPGIVDEFDLLVPEATGVKVADLSPDGRQALLIATFGNESRLWLRDLNTGASREMGSRGRDVNTAIFDTTGDVTVSGDAQGIRVGPTRGGEPHLLLSRERNMRYLAVSPDGRWIASEANTEDYAIRLWPMPDLDKPPLHTLPRDELVAKLKSLTNLRAVRDETSSTGWSIEIGPFPGWEEVPEW